MILILFWPILVCGSLLFSTSLYLSSLRCNFLIPQSCGSPVREWEVQKVRALIMMNNRHFVRWYQQILTSTTPACSSSSCWCSCWSMLIFQSCKCRQITLLLRYPLSLLVKFVDALLLTKPPGESSRVSKIRTRFAPSRTHKARTEKALSLALSILLKPVI